MAGFIFALGAVLFVVFSFFGPACAQAQNQGPPSFTPEQAARAAEKMTDIHDIRGLAEFSVFPPVLWWILGAVFVLLCLLGWWIVKKRKKGPARMNVPPISPDDAALAALSVLHGRIHDGVKPFYYELSAVLRAYLKGRYDFRALEMTTQELLPRIEELPVGADVKNQLARLSDVADLVKYAGGRVDVAVMEQDLVFVRDFVLMTRHKEEAAPDSLETTQLEPSAV